MKKIEFSESVLSLLLLSACANQALVPPLPEKAYITIAEDATHQLTSLYPPAQTHFILATVNNNVFDRQFKALLRNSGYALQEAQENVTDLNPKRQRLSYVLDSLRDVSHYSYYRFTLNIGEAQLSRLYDANDLKKPNYWSYRK